MKRETRATVDGENFLEVEISSQDLSGDAHRILKLHSKGFCKVKQVSSLLEQIEAAQEDLKKAHSTYLAERIDLISQTGGFVTLAQLKQVTPLGSEVLVNGKFVKADSPRLRDLPESTLVWIKDLGPFQHLISGSDPEDKSAPVNLLKQFVNGMPPQLIQQLPPEFWQYVTECGKPDCPSPPTPPKSRRLGQ